MLSLRQLRKMIGQVESRLISSQSSVPVPSGSIMSNRIRSKANLSIASFAAETAEAVTTAYPRLSKRRFVIKVSCSSSSTSKIYSNCVHIPSSLYFGNIRKTEKPLLFPLEASMLPP